MPVSRELSVTYGSFVVSTANDRFLTGRIRVDEGPDITSVEFDFVIKKTTEADFDTEIAAVESAFRTPRKDLTISQGAATLFSFSHGSNTGMNARPQIIKADDDADSGRSRFYTARIEFDMPADVHATSGRRDSTVELNFEPSRQRVLTVSGIYTALGGNSARAQYNASVDAYISGITTGFGGTWEKVSETASADDQDKLLTFSQIHKEILFNQSGAGLDDVDIVDQQLTVETAEPAPGDSFVGVSPKRPAELNLTYDAWIDKEKTTSLKAKYDGTIRPHLIDSMFNFFGGGVGALIREAPRFDGPRNKISVSMTMLVPTTSILEFRWTREIALQHGLEHVPVWAGDSLAYYQFQGPAVHRRTTTQTARELGGNTNFANAANARAGRGGGRVNLFGRGVQAVGGVFGLGGTLRFEFPRDPVGGPPGAARRASPEEEGDKAGKAAAVQPAPFGALGGPQWVEIESRETRTPLRLGLAGNQIDVTDTTSITIEQRVKLVTPPTVSRGA